MVVALVVGILFLLTSALTLYAMSDILGGRHRKRRLQTIDLIGVCGLWEVSVAAAIAAMPHQSDWSAGLAPGLLGIFMIAGWWLRRFGFLRHF